MEKMGVPKRSREALAWAAGIYEGEGNCRARRGGGGGGCSLKVSMVDEDVVRRFRDTLGVGRLRVERPMPNGKRLWTFEVNSFQMVQAVIAMLWHWLGARRREQAKATLAVSQPRTSVALRSRDSARMKALWASLTPEQRKARLDNWGRKSRWVPGQRGGRNGA